MIWAHHSAERFCSLPQLLVSLMLSRVHHQEQDLFAHFQPMMLLLTLWHMWTLMIAEGQSSKAKPAHFTASKMPHLFIKMTMGLWM